MRNLNKEGYNIYKGSADRVMRHLNQKVNYIHWSADSVMLVREQNPKIVI